MHSHIEIKKKTHKIAYVCIRVVKRDRIFHFKIAPLQIVFLRQKMLPDYLQC